jgi:hypothetical protein
LQGSKKRRAAEQPEDQQQPTAKQQRRHVPEEGKQEQQQQQQQQGGRSKHKPVPIQRPPSAKHLQNRNDAVADTAVAAAAERAASPGWSDEHSHGMTWQSEEYIRFVTAAAAADVESRRNAGCNAPMDGAAAAADVYSQHTDRSSSLQLNAASAARATLAAVGAAGGIGGRRVSMAAAAAAAAGREQHEEGRLRLDQLFPVTKAWPPLCYQPLTDEQVAKRRQERLKWQEQPVHRA